MVWQHMVPVGGWLERLSAIVPSATIVVSSADALVAQRRLSHGQIRKVSPGVDLEGIRSHVGDGRAIRSWLGWDNQTLVGIVGRLQPWKGQRVFLDAAERLAVWRPDLRFCVIGGAILGWEGSYECDLRKMVERSVPLHGRVHFAGH